MLNLPLFQLSDIKNSSSNVLDLVFVNDHTDVRVSVDTSNIIEKSEQDIAHKPIEILFEVFNECVTAKPDVIEFFSYQRGNYQRMRDQLDGIDFADKFTVWDIESSFDYFYEVLGTITHDNVPKVKILQHSQCDIALNEFNELNDRLHKEYVDVVQKNIAANPAEFCRYARLKQT